MQKRNADTYYLLERDCRYWKSCVLNHGNKDDLMKEVYEILEPYDITDKDKLEIERLLLKGDSIAYGHSKYQTRIVLVRGTCEFDMEEVSNCTHITDITRR